MLLPWAAAAETVAFNGFSPIPIRPGTKQPQFPKWPQACYAPPNPCFISEHAKKFPDDSVGLACRKDARWRRQHRVAIRRGLRCGEIPPIAPK